VRKHWIVVAWHGAGDRQRTRQDGARELNRSTFRSARSIAWKNPGKIQLELIEVQDGQLFREDDIIRIEDDYRRS